MQLAVFLLFGIVGLSAQHCNNVNRCCRETARGFDCVLKRDPCSCIFLCGVADNAIVDIGRATHRIFASERLIIHQQSTIIYTRLPCQGAKTISTAKSSRSTPTSATTTTTPEGPGWGLTTTEGSSSAPTSANTTPEGPPPPPPPPPQRVRGMVPRPPPPPQRVPVEPQPPLLPQRVLALPPPPPPQGGPAHRRRPRHQ